MDNTPLAVPVTIAEGENIEMEIECRKTFYLFKMYCIQIRKLNYAREQIPKKKLSVHIPV